MRSIKTTVTAAAVLTAGFVLAAPAAQAATAAPQAKDTCKAAIHTAEKARHDYDAAVADLKKQIAAGGHPGTAEEQNVTDLMNAAKTAVWNAVEVCKRGEDRKRGDEGKRGEENKRGDEGKRGEENKRGDEGNRGEEGMRGEEGHHHMMMHRHPHGAMHTGVGSTSQGVNGGELAGGVGILSAAGFGALALRRRRGGKQS